MVARLLRLIFAAEVLAFLLVTAWLAGIADWPLWLAAIVGLALTPLVSAWFIGLQSLIGASMRQNWRAELEGQEVPPLTRGAAVRAWAGETGASLLAFVLRAPWYGDTSLPSGADSHRLPIVLVHGYFCNRAVWRTMARRLARRGHSIESVNLEPVFGGIDDYVTTIEAAVTRLCERTGERQVALVGHSMGGLAIRAWLRRHGAARAAAIVTLGTPHRGTWSANFGIGVNVAQMRQGSKWLATLAQSETPEIRKLFTVIIALHDNVVMPQAVQTLEDARTVVLVGVGHIALLGSRKALRATTEALDRATAPTRSG